MTKPSATPSNAGRTAKGDRTPVITRFPRALLAKIDARAEAESLTRQDAIEAGMKRWADGAPRAAAPDTPAPPPNAGPNRVARPAKTAPGARQAAAAEAHVDRLDKTQIGKRLAPKAGARQRKPVEAEPEEVV